MKNKVPIYVQAQEKAKDFWVNKLGFVVKFGQPMGPSLIWLEVGPSEDNSTTLVLHSKAFIVMEQQPVSCELSIY